MAAKVVLVVDEDDGVRAEIRRCLSGRQISCREATTARDALRSALADPPDLILVELVLPDQSGLGLCRTLRESESLAAIPIIVLTQRATEMDRVLAFEAGADDFLAKPFSHAELGARIAAVLRGFAGATGPHERTPDHGAIDIDRRSGRAIVEGRPIELTPRELDLLEALMSQAGRVVRRSALIERLWAGDAPHSERAIDAHIKSIRRKLGRARHYIETVRGIGYRLSEAAISRDRPADTPERHNPVKSDPGGIW